MKQTCHSNSGADSCDSWPAWDKWLLLMLFVWNKPCISHVGKGKKLEPTWWWSWLTARFLCNGFIFLRSYYLIVFLFSFPFVLELLGLQLTSIFVNVLTREQGKKKQNTNKWLWHYYLQHRKWPPSTVQNTQKTYRLYEKNKQTDTCIFISSSWTTFFMNLLASGLNASHCACARYRLLKILMVSVLEWHIRNSQTNQPKPLSFSLQIEKYNSKQLHLTNQIYYYNY